MTRSLLLRNRSSDIDFHHPTGSAARGYARWWVAALTLSVLLTGQWFSTAHAVAGPSAGGTPVTAPPADAGNPYAAVVVALAGPRPVEAVSVLPGSFASTQGYSPEVIDGYPVDPQGDCSSPVPLPAHFTPLCRTHDFGYDLLRAAQKDGDPLGPWARFALDRMLVDRMYAACGSPGCTAAASATRVGLAWNTWRQRGGPPAGNESITALVTTTLERALVDSTHEAVRS